MVRLVISPDKPTFTVDAQFYGARPMEHNGRLTKATLHHRGLTMHKQRLLNAVY